MNIMKKIKLYTLLALLMLSISSCFDNVEFNIPEDQFWIAFDGESNLNISENNTDAVMATINYSGVTLSQPLTINYTISFPDAGAASENVDFTLPAESGSVTIPVGEFQTEFVLLASIINDEIAKGTRSLTFTLQSTNNLNLGEPDAPESTSITINILEDDFTEIAFSSFEEPTTFGTTSYSAPAGNDLPNNNGQPPVDYASTGNELGFNTSYIIPGGEDNSVDMGVWNEADFTLDGAAFDFPDGSQAYASSDSDGLLEIEFDEVNIANGATTLLIEADVYFTDASWEDDDEFDIFYRTEDGDELVISLRANADGDMTNSPDGTGSNIEGQWIKLTGEISTIKSGKIAVQIGQNSGSELLFIDRVSLKGIL